MRAANQIREALLVHSNCKSGVCKEESRQPAVVVVGSSRVCSGVIERYGCGGSGGSGGGSGSGGVGGVNVCASGFVVNQP